MALSLNKRFKETLSHGLIYGLGETSSRIIGFLLIPLYTRELTTTEYGLLSILTICGTVIIVIFGLGLNTALFASYYDSRSGSTASVVSTAFYLALASTLVVIGLGWFTSPLISTLLFGNQDFKSHLILIALTAAADILASLALAVYRARKLSKRYSLINIIFITVRLGLVVYLVAFLNTGVWGVLIGNLITSVLKTIVLFLTILGNLRFAFSIIEARRLLSFGLPLIFTSLGGIILNLSDRFFLNYYASLSAVGVYNLGYQFGLIINYLLILPLKLIWPPMLFSVQREQYAERYYSRMLSYFGLLALFLALGISVLADDVIRIVADPSYWEASIVVLIIALSYVLWGFQEIVGVGILLERKTRFSPIVTLSAALLNLGLNFVLIPTYGIIGAAIATLVAFSLAFLIRYWIGQQLVYVRYEWKRIVVLFGVTTLIYVGLDWWTVNNPVLSLAIKGPLLLTYPIFLYLFGFFEKEETEFFSGYLRKIRSAIIL